MLANNLTYEKAPDVVPATSEALPKNGFVMLNQYKSSSNSRQALDETVRRLQREKGERAVFWGYQWPRITRQARGGKR
jgi:hypothetical protein